MSIEAPVFATKKEGVYRALRDAIIRCELQPEARLVVDELSRRMGVSTIPIREALQQLQAEGLVRIVPYVGAIVAPVPTEAVDEVFFLLEHIESALASRACGNCGEGDLQDLRKLLSSSRAAEEAGDGEAWATANSAFHRRIAAMAQMPLVEDIANRVYDSWDRLRHYLLGRQDLTQRMLASRAEHEAIVDALRARDRVALRRLLRGHRRAALEAFHRAAQTRQPRAP